VAIAGGAMAGVQASVPPHDPDFRPSTALHAGPARFCHSTYSIVLNEGEHATLRQVAPWANQVTIVLKEGEFSVFETFAGFVSGRFYRRFGEGRLLRVAREPRQFLFDNGLPGSTKLVFDRQMSMRQVMRLFSRIAFAAPRADDANCSRGTLAQ
jgi:hypothetical protein